MGIIGKITPKIYEYLRFAGKSSVLEVKPISRVNVSGLKYNANFAQSLKYKPEEISSAYREYAKSPYINYYLREGVPLSEQNNKLVSCLKQGIRESIPKTGKFYRGIQNCPDDKTAEKLIFQNLGFTSVTPEINKNYAKSFAVGKNSAIVEFDLKKPLKGFQENNYEVIFDTKAFTSDKYKIKKVKDSLFRVTEKNEAVKFAPITQHFEEGGSLVFGTLPDNYVAKSREFIKAHTITYKFGPYKGQTKTFPDSWEETQSILPHYHIDKLWSNGKGSGTNSVQSVVRKSVNDPKTAGRVTLDACCIDGKTSPAGFYYKLGFRFKDKKMNKQLEEWIANGGKRENSPFLTGMMYLPAENIEHCLNYKVI